MWKNSSWVRSLFASSWMSSTTSTSMFRYLSRKVIMSPFSRASMKWFTNVSQDRYRIRESGNRSSTE